jgi:hypothetical protein
MQLITLRGNFAGYYGLYSGQILRRTTQATGSDSPEANAFVRLQYPVQNFDVLFV